MKMISFSLLTSLVFFMAPSTVLPGQIEKSKENDSRKVESVMIPGMQIEATTSVGIIKIGAEGELIRTYTWEGETRSVEMWPRMERWYGSLGLYYPGPGSHWKEHHGITRGVLEEGQQHFQTVEEALKWIKARDWIPYVYNNNGLVVGWEKVLAREQLNVEVWQIFINGSKPDQLAGSQNDKINVSKVQISMSPIIQAIRDNRLETLQLHLSKGADPNTTNTLGKPALILAVENGNPSMVQLLLEKGVNIESGDINGGTALIYAIQQNNNQIATYLIEKGANVNAFYRSGGIIAGSTPLLGAVLRCNAPMVRKLIQHEADVNVRAKIGTPLQCAENNNHQEIIALLKQAGAKQE